MSAKNTSSVQSVESLRAALSSAQAMVIQLEAALAAAEEAAATEAVLAMVETVEEPIPAEPDAGFFGRSGDFIGPREMGETEFFIGRDILPLSADGGGGVQAYLRPFGRSGGVEWCGYLIGRIGEVPVDDMCSGCMSWADAVRWGHRMFAKWSVGAASVVAIAA